mgnify:CR=1 FL=1
MGSPVSYIYLKSITVEPTAESIRGSDQQQAMPDGRQTRIDFFSGSKGGRKPAHVVAPKRSSLEWWQTITGWLRQSDQAAEERQLETFRNYLQERNYSTKSCSSYIYMLKKFFDYMDSKAIQHVSLGVIEDYNYDFFVSGRYSRSYQLQFINGMTHYLEFAHGVKVNLKGLRKAKARR